MDKTNIDTQQFHKIMLFFVLAHIPVLFLFSTFLGLDISKAEISILALSCLAGLSYYPLKTSPLGRDIMGIVLVSIPAVMVYLLSGHPWQIDAHMYFFCMLAVLAGFRSIRTILVSAAFIAVHHLLFNFTIPEILFPNGADFYRVMFHAVIVVIQTSILLKIVYERQKVMSNITQEFDANLASIVASIDQSANFLKDNFGSLNDILTETKISTQSVSTLSSETSRSITTVASAASQLSLSSQQINTDISDTEHLASACMQTARIGHDRLVTLAQAVSDIDAYVQAINDVSQRTNLLALNATIEAARAGEYGKGFAVVANEVKDLANKTQETTERINESVLHIKEGSDKVSLSLNEIISTIESINKHSVEITGAANQQSASIQEISHVANDISKSSDEVSKSFVTVERNVAKGTEMAEKIRQMSENIATQSRSLKTTAGNLLNSLRTR